MKFEYQKYQVISNQTFKDKYPFLYSSLNLYYPVGLKLSNNNHKDYIGQKTLNELIKHNIESKENLRLKWTEGFLKKVAKKTNYRIIDATYGLTPNFGGKIVLNQSDNLRFSTELCFFVSLLDNFYSIQITYTDRFTIFEREFLPNIIGNGTKKVIVSPINKEYDDLFNHLDELIQIEFENAKFLPFRFDLIKLKDFEVANDYSDKFCTQISKAFFQKAITLNEETEIIGNIDYKLDEIQN